MLLKRFAVAGVVLISLTTAACGGGGGAAPAAPNLTAAPTAGPVVQSLPAATAGGITANITVTANGSLTEAVATSFPAGTGVLARRRIATPATGSALLYITLASSNTTISAIGGTFTLASAPTQAVWLAYWTGTEWDSVSPIPATISGTTATFATVALSPAVVANPNAYFGLYTASGAAMPSPTPTATSTTGTAGNFVDTACSQAAATPTNTLTNVASTFFSQTIPNAKTICLSAWDLSSDIDTALASAASNGANVTVITPSSEYSSNKTAIGALIAAGVNVKFEHTGNVPATPTPGPRTAFESSPMDIHAKFALVDGVAYMDGHNWFTTDVVMKDGYAADFAAIQADLTTFATPAPSGSGPTSTFTTDKQQSLKNESAYLQTVLNTGIGPGNEYDFITESFNPTGDGEYNDDVYAGMCAIAMTHATMHVMAETYSGYSTASQSALQNLLAIDPNAVLKSDNSGHEKISMVRTTIGGTPTSAWFGSSNSTTTDLFDWGMNIIDPGMLGALQSYFDGVFSNATAVTSTNASPTACPTTHP